MVVVAVPTDPPSAALGRGRVAESWWLGHMVAGVLEAELLQCCGPVNTVALDRLHFWLAAYSAQTALGLMAVMAVLWAVL